MEAVNSRKKAELMALPFFLGLGINFLETPGTIINIFHNIYYANLLVVFPAGVRSYRKPGIPAELPNQAAITGSDAGPPAVSQPIERQASAFQACVDRQRRSIEGSLFTEAVPQMQL